MVVVAIVLISFVSEAEAGPKAGKKAPVSKAEFFSVERAKNYWFTIESLDELKAKTENQAYAEWVSTYSKLPAQMGVAALVNHPEAEQIKAAHDAWTVWQLWRFRTRKWAWPTKKRAHLWKAWGDWDEKTCRVVTKNNPFEKTCDVPDWRTPEMKERDRQAVLKYGS